MIDGKERVEVVVRVSRGCGGGGSGVEVVGCVKLAS